MKIKLLLPALLCVLPTVPAAEINASLEIRLGKVLPPPPPEVIIIEQAPRPGPPPWAPAHGARRNHAYYYYPGADVYFRPADRVWFYLEGREWRFGASLPTNIRVDFNRAVSLNMESDRPYQFHNEVRGHYPADYFVTKVKVKDNPPGRADGGREDDSSGNGNGNSAGNGKGKGKGKNK